MSQNSTKRNLKYAYHKKESLNTTSSLKNSEIKMDENSLKKQESINTAFLYDIRPYIDVIDGLRSLGVDRDVKLPTVVVVGDQSSGKSSIIEALSGIQLPRGSGIVTRCPLELQLIRGNKKSNWKATLKYRSIVSKTENKNEVDKLIREAQNDICGHNKDVKEELLTLRIEDPRPTAPDLTLIDLPGISRTPVEGQPENICETIRNLVMRYISNENAVILCMVSANLDFAVNESLQIAKKVDPTNERTIGVVTKPDLADPHQKKDVLKVLDNKKYELKKGYVIVKCRSQQELDEELSVEDSVNAEMDFFDNDPLYSYIENDKKGIQNLAKKITAELVEAIKKCIPSLKDEIDSQLKKAQMHLSKLPQILPQTANEKAVYLAQITHRACVEFEDFLKKGTVIDGSGNGFYTWRISFDKFFEKIEQKRKDIFKRDFSLDNLSKLIQLNRGREINLFLDFDLFSSQIKKYLQSYICDSEELTQEIHKSVEKTLLDMAEKNFRHVPSINIDFKTILIDKCRGCLEECLKKIKWIFEQEGIVFTMDTLFFKDYQEQIQIEYAKQNKVTPASASNIFGSFQENVTDTKRQKLDNSNCVRKDLIQQEYFKANSQSNAELMQRMLKVYLKIVNKRLADRIPMLVMHCLLLDLSKQLNISCHEYPVNISIDEKIIENERVIKERENWTSKADRLHKAQLNLSCF